MKIKFVREDKWVGLYHKSKELEVSKQLIIVRTTWYLCVLPMLPIIWETNRLKIDTGEGTAK